MHLVLLVLKPLAHLLQELCDILSPLPLPLLAETATYGRTAAHTQQGSTNTE